MKNTTTNAVEIRKKDEIIRKQTEEIIHLKKIIANIQQGISLLYSEFGPKTVNSPEPAIMDPVMKVSPETDNVTSIDNEELLENNTSSSTSTRTPSSTNRENTCNASMLKNTKKLPKVITKTVINTNNPYKNVIGPHRRTSQTVELAIPVLGA